MALKPPQKPIIIGTRGSPLALWQAHNVRDKLLSAHGWEALSVEIKILKTKGDQIKGHLSEFGGKGLFTRELEDALIDGRIDMAVHSMKDVPTLGHERLEIGGVLERADPRDGFISENVKGVLDLPQEAMIGTASIRRRAQLSRLRPDIKFCLLRGNVGTRLSKLKDGLFDATFLACAGLKRLGQSDVITQEVPPELMLPAPAQGAIGIEHRRDDESIALAIAALNHSSSQMAIWAERAFLEALDGSCRTPIAALATLDGEAMSFRGEVIATDGSKHYGTQALETIASKEAARDLGLAMGAEVKTQIGDIDLWDRD